jgi:hypothetical protein
LITVDETHAEELLHYMANEEAITLSCLATSKRDVERFQQTHASEQFRDDDDTGHKRAKELELEKELLLGDLVRVHKETRLLGGSGRGTGSLLVTALTFLNVPHYNYRDQTRCSFRVE